MSGDPLTVREANPIGSIVAGPGRGVLGGHQVRDVDVDLHGPLGGVGSRCGPVDQEGLGEQQESVCECWVGACGPDTTGVSRDPALDVSAETSSACRWGSSVADRMP